MQNRFHPILFGGEGGGSALADAGLLVLRLFAGLSLAFAHGLGKLPPSAGFVEATDAMGFPFPTFFAWCAALSEFGGGLLIALGLLTRPAAFFVGFTMAVAGLVSGAGDPYTDNEKALLFLAVAVALMLTGSGRYGLDRFIRPRRDDRIWR
jgi:putative oxidoreductase